MVSRHWQVRAVVVGRDGGGRAWAVVVAREKGVRARAVVVGAQGGGSRRASDVVPHVRRWVSDSVVAGVRSWEPASDHQAGPTH